MSRVPQARLLICAFLVTLLAGGCVSSDSAAQLAKNGSVLTKSAEDSIATTGNALDSYVESEYLLAGLTESPPPDQKLLGDIEEVRAVLTQRTEMLKKLESLYDSYGKLASYDASKEVKDAVGPLIDSINAYNGAVYKAETKPPDAPATAQPVFSTADGDLIKELAGGTASWIQSTKLRSGSATIRRFLERIIPVMEREARVYQSIERVSAQTLGTASTELYRSGIGKPHPIIRHYVESCGLEFDPAQVDAVLSGSDAKKKKQLQDAVGYAIQARVDRQAALRAGAIQQTIAALHELKKEHEDFEKGKEVEFAGLASDLSLLRHYTERLQKADEERLPPTRFPK